MQFTVDLSIDLVDIVTDVGSECLDDGRLVVLLSNKLSPQSIEFTVEC